MTHLKGRSRPGIGWFVTIFDRRCFGRYSEIITIELMFTSVNRFCTN